MSHKQEIERQDVKKTPHEITARYAIEITFPFAEVGIESAKEKQGIRKGHPVGLHRWWARRPLVACRAAVIGCLLDATSAENAEHLIRSLCTWEASGKVFQSLGDHATGKSILDSFGGGGAIPLEALRCGCSVTSTDINPVAHLIQRAILEFPQRFSSRNPEVPPDYVHLLNGDQRSNNTQRGLFEKQNNAAPNTLLHGVSTQLLPRMVAKEYQHNPLAADVRIWGNG